MSSDAKATSTPKENKRLFRVKEAADYLGLSPATIWRALKDGRLKAIKLMGRTLIERADLDAMVDHYSTPIGQ